MNIDTLFTKIQNIVNNNPAVVLGSGASVSYGIASMGQLASILSNFFKRNSYSEDNEKEAVKTFLENINSKHMGLENALLDIRMPNKVERDIKEQVWKEIQKEDSKVYEKVLQDFQLPLSVLLDYMIYNRSKEIINVITTNYDRIVEYAISQTKAYLNTFYTNKPIGSFDQPLLKRHYSDNYIGCVNVLKVHGSLDWFEKDGNLYSFVNSRNIPENYQPCIITPGTNKYEKVSQLPYRSLLEQVDNVFKDTSGFLCIGYGFNDKHIHPYLLNYAEKKKITILIVTKDLTDTIKNGVMIKNKYPYIVVCKNKKGGTMIYDSDESKPLEIKDKDYWTIEGLCEIIK